MVHGDVFSRVSGSPVDTKAVKSSSLEDIRGYFAGVDGFHHLSINIYQSIKPQEKNKKMDRYYDVIIYGQLAIILDNRSSFS